MRKISIKQNTAAAFIHTVTGSLFAVTLSFLIIIFPSVPFIGNPFLVVNRIGIGWGMGVYADQFGGRRHGPAAGSPDPRLERVMNF